jgi:hypothetical protein
MMKMKGLKRERRERAEERDDAKKRKAAGLEPEEDDE